MSSTASHTHSSNISLEDYRYYYFTDDFSIKFNQ